MSGKHEDADLKPINHKRTPSFELVLRKIRADGKDPRLYNIKRVGPSKYQIKLKSDDEIMNQSVQLEYVRDERTPPPRKVAPRKRISSMDSDEDLSDADIVSRRRQEKYRRRPDPSQIPINKKKERRGIAHSHSKKYKSPPRGRNISDYTQSTEKVPKRKPKSILKSRSNASIDSDEISGDEHDLLSPQTEREGRSKKKYSDRKEHNESRSISRKYRSRARSRSREVTKRNGKIRRQEGEERRKKGLSEYASPVKKTSKMLNKQDQKSLDDTMLKLSVSLQGVQTPDSAQIQQTYYDKGTSVQGRVPEVTGKWDGMNDVLSFVQSIYPSHEDKERIKTKSVTTKTHSANPAEVKKLLTDEESSKDIKDEKTASSSIPKLKGLNVILSEDSQKAKVKKPKRKKAEKIRVGAPKGVHKREHMPFAFTTMYNEITRFPRIVDTSLVIPESTESHQSKIASAIKSIDLIVDEYKAEYLQMDRLGNLVTMPPPECLMRIICMPNFSKNQSIEPPSGFGMVMSSTKNVPIKTTPFNPTKFFYGTLAFRIPTDIHVDTDEAIRTFHIKFTDSLDKENEMTLLEYLEESPRAFLAESLIPSDAKEYDNESEFPISETPMMDAFIDGRGSYAGLYMSCSRSSDWKKHLWVVVQCNDPKTSQELYDHLRKVQDEGMGIRDEDRGFSLSRKNRNPVEADESSEGSSSTPDATRKGDSANDELPKQPTSPIILANWAVAIFNNTKVRAASNTMSEARLQVAIELLSAYGVNVTAENIKEMCHPYVETVTNTFYHDKTMSTYMFAGSGVTIITPDTKEVVIGESPIRGPIILHGPPKSRDTRTSVKDSTLRWNLSDARGLYRLFPCATGRHRTNKDLREYIKTLTPSLGSKVPKLEHIVYRGKFDKEIRYYKDVINDDESKSSELDIKNSKFIDPQKGHYHARLTDISYNRHTSAHRQREQKCGYNRDWPITELQPIAIRVGVEREKVNLFSF